MTDLLVLSAVELAEQIRNGLTSAGEAVDAHIAQIERVNGSINALVQDRFDDARREADAADEILAQVSSSELPPLHGVPCTIKECFALTGMPNTAGLKRRRGVVANTDATSVRRLRDAGAIPLGVTNTSELCMWMESNNYVYGRTNNPYDAGRIAGGSSGGEGAIVASGGSPFGLGSDVGGSIRGPAFFNGVFGHKPTGTVVPGTGQYPPAENEALRFLTTGPLTRRASDIMPLLRILAGPDGKDEHCVDWPLGDPTTVSLSGRTVVVVKDNGSVRVNAEMRQAQERAAASLEAAGMVVREETFSGLKRQAEIWSAMLAGAQDTPFSRLMGGESDVKPTVELLKWAVGRSEHTFMCSLLGAVEQLPKKFPRYGARLQAEMEKLKAEMLEAMGPEGVLLYPPYPTPAPRHYTPILSALTLQMPWAYTGIMNILEFPVTQVPLGLSRGQLPLGVQVVSRHGNDHLTAKVAAVLEHSLGGWSPPAISGLQDASTRLRSAADRGSPAKTH